MNQFIQKHHAKIKDFSKKNHISYLGLFGSQARLDSKPGSDVDLLVEFAKPIDLVDLIQTQHKLEDLLNRKVDLITKKGVSPHLKPFIEKNLHVIYERT